MGCVKRSWKTIGAVLAVLLLTCSTFALAGPAAPARARAKPAKSAAARKPSSKQKTSNKKKAAKKRTPPAQTAPTRDRIIEIQQALANAGAYQGDPTGKWDSASSEAMSKFQSSHGLTATGKINALTLDKLGLGSETAGKGAPIARAPAGSAPPAATSGNSATTP